MSAKPNMSVPTAHSDAPLRPISFSDPAVTIERRDDGTIYLRPKKPLGEYPKRLTDRLHHWAGAMPDRVFMAEREPSGWRQISYAQLLTASRHIASALLSARAFGRKAGRHPLRQFDRSCVGRVRRALCGHSVLPGVAGLFAGFERLRQAGLPDEAADAGSRVRRRRRQIRRRARSQRFARNRNRRLPRRLVRSRRDQARRSPGDADLSGPRRRA